MTGALLQSTRGHRSLGTVPVPIAHVLNPGTTAYISTATGPGITR